MQTIGRYISILYRRSTVYFNTALEEFGITATEQPLLLLLYKMNGASQEELSSFLMIDRASTTRAIESLVKKRYVRKERDPRDKRATQIYLTDKMTGFQEQFHQRSEEWTRFLLEGEPQEDVETLLRLLEHMIERVQTTDIKERWSSNGSDQSAGN